MMELAAKAAEIISGRGVWEQKQRLYYAMRHDGLRRRNKPFPTASDAHFPLIDMQIRKYKPFWLGQALAADRLATFIAQRDQLGPVTESAADYFDFELKNRTDFTRKLRVSNDYMLLTGRGILKAYVDPFDDYRIIFEAINPVLILMPDVANDFGDAEMFTHVKHLTVGQYKRDRRFNQDPALIRRIKGQKDIKLAQFWQDKELREGITHSKADDIIVIWETVVKTPGGWTVHTYSPQQIDEPLRTPHGIPYKFQGKPSLPYFSFVMEVKDEGWYAPRGVAELCAPFETYATKLWNEKADAMTFGNRPVFTSEKEIPNTANIRWAPGEIIPGMIQAVQMPQPAFSFDQEINFSRATSEQLIMMPDFGISQGGPVQGGGGDRPRTATENNRIAQLQTVGTNDNGLIFQEDLAKLYRHVWGLMLQFKKAQMAYLAGEQLKTLPVQALHDEYLIMPGGATDEWDRQRRQQKAERRMMMYRGAPNVNQDELVRSSLAADDPRFALKVFIPTAQKAGSEAEDEATEIGIMLLGFPAQVLPQEDHVTRIHVLLGFLQKQGMTGAPVDPIARQRIQEHLVMHWQMLKQTQPQAAAQLEQQLKAGPPGGLPVQGGQPGQGNAAPPQGVGNPS